MGWFRLLIAAVSIVLVSALPVRAEVKITVTTTINITRDKTIVLNLAPFTVTPDLSTLGPAIVGAGIAVNETQNNDSFIGPVGGASFLALIDGENNGSATPLDVRQSEGFLINQGNVSLAESHTPAISEISSTQTLTNNDLMIGSGETREAAIVDSLNNNSASVLVDQSAGIVGNQLNIDALAQSPAGGGALSSSEMEQINTGNRFTITTPSAGPHTTRLQGSINGNAPPAPGGFFLPVIGVNQSAGIGTNQSNNVSQSISSGP